MASERPGITRRGVLAGAALAATGSAGCLRRIRNVAGRDPASQVALEILTTPADSDPHAIRIARHLANNLDQAGVAARVTTLSEAELYRRVLLNHDFDLYVGRYPEDSPMRPDALFPLLYSEFSSEPGWQNPFGFTDLGIDELLLEQRRRSGDGRLDVVIELQNEIAKTQPFVTVAFPDALTAIQRDRFLNWDGRTPTSTLGLLAIEAEADERIESSADDGDAEESEERPTLRLATTDLRITENRNPIAAEYRRHGTFTELMYDSLARIQNGELIPWLASDWEWVDSSTLDVTVREMSWHDDERVSASDIVFTYEFLADTSMGEAESPIPASRFRGEVTLIDDVRVQDRNVVRFTIDDVSQEVALEALTVPILPEHVWREHTGPATIAGIEVDQETTEALVWNNPEPIGSGPVRFVEATPEESVTFERNDRHFLSTDNEGIPQAYHDKPAFGRLEIDVVPSDIAAVQLVGDGIADATVSKLGPDAVPRIGREADAQLLSAHSGAFYHVGFNTRRSPLSNPRFRQVLAQLLDKGWLVDEAFQGYARPAATPLARTEWMAPQLMWAGEDPETPFLGLGGELDVEAARDAFRDVGYRYNDEGELISTDQ